MVTPADALAFGGAIAAAIISGPVGIVIGYRLTVRGAKHDRHRHEEITRLERIERRLWRIEHRLTSLNAVLPFIDDRFPSWPDIGDEDSPSPTSPLP